MTRPDLQNNISERYLKSSEKNLKNQEESQPKAEE